jgi:uncharacterized membrane protein YhiD involved in acid resistance
MDTVFEALLFIAIGLLGINITIFVLAVSLLGRAIKISLQEQKDVQEKAKKEIDDKIEEAKNTPDVEGRQKYIEELTRIQQQHQKKLNWIKTKPTFLQVNGGGLVPAVSFLISIVFCILARYSLSQNPNDSSVIVLLCGTILFILVGIFITYLILKVIESVAVTSDETAFVREAEALKKAMIEVEDAKKTELRLDFSHSKPPFKIKINSETEISCDLFVKKGYSAKNPEIVFWIPKEFSIIRGLEPIPTRNSRYPDYVSFCKSFTDFIRPFGRNVQFTIKAPSTFGVFHGVYRISCEGFVSGYTEFEITVE